MIGHAVLSGRAYVLRTGIASHPLTRRPHEATCITWVLLMPLIPCARCGQKKRTVLFELLVPVNVCINYHTHEHRDFPATTLFCGRCLHCLLPTYGGRSEGLTIAPGSLMPSQQTIRHAYVRTDGVPVTRAIIPGTTKPPPSMS